MASELSTIELIRTLERAVEANDLPRLTDVMRMIQGSASSFTRQELKQTNATRTVADLRKHADKTVQSIAADTVNTWKTMFQQPERRPSSSKPATPAGATSTPTPTPDAPAEASGGRLVAAKYVPTTVLSAPRMRARGILFQTLLTHAESDDDVEPITVLAEVMEDSLCGMCGSDPESHTYKARLTSLAYNLKQNERLSRSVITGEVDAGRVARMPVRELASDEARQRMIENEQKSLEARQADWEDQNYELVHQRLGIKPKSLYKCKYCGSFRTQHIQKQTRSGDEPMTVFLYCVDCKKRDKF